MRVGLSSESWAPKNCCFWNVVLEKTLESPLDCKEIKPVHPKVNQPWVCIGRTDAEAEAPILWPPDVKGLHIGKDADAGKAWGQEEKRMTEDKIIGWHHQLNGNKFEQTPANSEGQGNLVWCNSWGCRESDTTEWLYNKQRLSLDFWQWRQRKMDGIRIYFGDIMLKY